MATPIGNLADISERARQALEAADRLLCEDTRQGAKLLNALGIAKSMAHLERLDAHTPPAKFKAWTDQLLAGRDFVLITDAGTPGVSDPGAELVAYAREQGVRVEPIPGPSALLALMAASGLGVSSFTFRGFFPRKSGDQSQELALVSKSGLGGAFVWFESPHRIVAALTQIAEEAPLAKLVVAKELTKLHESFFVGLATEARTKVADEIEREGERGEWCFAAVFPAIPAAEAETGVGAAAGYLLALECMLRANVSVSEASRLIAEAFAQPKKRVYEAALKLKALPEKKK